jgi:hypothetical protein
MDYDPGYFDLDTRVLEPIGTSAPPKSVTYVSGTICNLCVRAGPLFSGAGGGIEPTGRIEIT